MSVPPLTLWRRSSPLSAPLCSTHTPCVAVKSVTEVPCWHYVRWCKSADWGRAYRFCILAVGVQFPLVNWIQKMTVGVTSYIIHCGLKCADIHSLYFFSPFFFLIDSLLWSQKVLPRHWNKWHFPLPLAMSEKLLESQSTFPLVLEPDIRQISAWTHERHTVHCVCKCREAVSTQWSWQNKEKQHLLSIMNSVCTNPHTAVIHDIH